MDSDHHIASVLTELAHKDMDDESIAHLLLLVKDNMSSDTHQATVLKHVASKQNFTSSLSDYLTALENVNSDHHKAAVFKLLSKKDFSDSQLTRILRATKEINSDHHRSESLLSFAPKVKSGSSSVRDAYMDACLGIDSEHHMGRAIKGIN